MIGLFTDAVGVGASSVADWPASLFGLDMTIYPHFLHLAVGNEAPAPGEFQRRNLQKQMPKTSSFVGQ